MIEIYHNPRCTKSRETLQLLESKGIEPKVIEYLKDIPTEKELKEILKKLGIKAYDLLRRNEAIFKEEYKGKDLTEDQWIEAMIEHPKLIERPIVINGKKAALGRPPEKVLDIL
ncbi:MAG: arsenate reductase (glutaredoxin) [Chitinophagales bacterium]